MTQKPDFQCLSDAVHYVMHDYIDDYVGMGLPDATHASFV